MCRGGVGRAWRLAGAFARRGLTSPPVLRFHVPLIEPDVRISRIRLSDKASCVRTRAAARKRRESHQPERLHPIAR